MKNHKGISRILLLGLGVLEECYVHPSNIALPLDRYNREVGRPHDRWSSLPVPYIRVRERHLGEGQRPRLGAAVISHHRPVLLDSSCAHKKEEQEQRDPRLILGSFLC